MIVSIYDIYHLTIGITDITNDLQNTFKGSSEQLIIDWTPNYSYWFKFFFPTIRTKPSPDGRYVMEIFLGMQGTKPSGFQRNKTLNMILCSLVFSKDVIDHSLYTLNKNSNYEVIIVGWYTDGVLWA